MSKDQDTGGTAAPAIASQLIEADPYLVAFSPNNPRKRKGLDVDSLSALAASIKAQGLAQPILVRPLPGNRAEDTFGDREAGRPLPAYELVCGERRVRASRLADLSTIPMIVRELDDDAALELQLVENIEREDLDPIEEAEGFHLLRTKLGYSVEQIADRIGRGKGPDYVRKAIKLLELAPESRTALEEGILGRSTALLVARYPAEQQSEVIAFIKSQAEGGEPAPYRAIAPRVFVRFNLDLKKAVWPIADADLVPAAGACTECPKRTGAHQDLFGDDENSPDSCTDADCFEGKRLAHIERVKAQAQKDGFKVIDGDEARKAIPSPFARYIDGYVKLSDVAYTVPGDDGKERQVTFEDALRGMGKKAPKPRIIINPHSGEAIKVITDDLADKLQPKSDEGDNPAQTACNRSFPDDDRPEDVKALDDWNVKRAVLRRLFDAIRGRDRTEGDMLLIAQALYVAIDDALPSLEDYMSWHDLEEAADQQKAIAEKLAALPPADLGAVLTMAAAEVAFTRYGFTREQELALATSYGIDVLAVRDKVAEDLDPGDGLDDDQDDTPPARAGEDALGDQPAGNGTVDFDQVETPAWPLPSGPAVKVTKKKSRKAKATPAEA